MAAVELYNTSLIDDPSLVGYWRMENNVVDSSTKIYTLTEYNTPSYSTGKFGNAISFASASSEYASIADASSAGLDITGSQTWSCWMKPVSTSTSYYIAGIRASGGGNYKGFWIGNTNNLYFALSGLTTSEMVEKTSALSTSAFNHVVGVYDSVNTKLKIFINKVKTEVTASGSTAAITASFSLGRLGDQAVNYYNGMLDDFAIFNRALSDAEVENMYDGTLPPRVIGGYFHMST